MRQFSQWSFERNGKTKRMSLAGVVTVNDPYLAVRAAVDGLGIAYTVEAMAEPFLRTGQLVRVLERSSPCLEGLFLYYPGRRQVPAALRAFIDMIRAPKSAQDMRLLKNPFLYRLHNGVNRVYSDKVRRLPGQAVFLHGGVIRLNHLIRRNRWSNAARPRCGG